MPEAPAPELPKLKVPVRIGLAFVKVRTSSTAQSNWSLLYWTVVGAYVIRGDRNDVSTLVDTAVFDVRTRKLLFRAPGPTCSAIPPR